MSNHQWAMGDMEDGDHFLQANGSGAQINIKIDAEDAIILHDMVNDLLETNGYEKEEVFANDE